jgi:hypothetical protein
VGSSPVEEPGGLREEAGSVVRELDRELLKDVARVVDWDGTSFETEVDVVVELEEDWIVEVGLTDDDSAVEDGPSGEDISDAGGKTVEVDSNVVDCAGVDVGSDGGSWVVVKAGAVGGDGSRDGVITGIIVRKSFSALNITVVESRRGLYLSC